jgi:hypothetical protein
VRHLVTHNIVQISFIFHHCHKSHANCVNWCYNGQYVEFQMEMSCLNLFLQYSVMF